MPHFRIVLAYDGTDYVGWQRQANGVSIQEVIEDALAGLDGRAVAVAGAGRTDSGVHALGQVAAFTIARVLAPDAVLRALNAHLPDDIRVMAAEEVPPSFHPRFDARAKTYRYRIWSGEVISPFERRYAWHVAGPLDADAMRAAAGLIDGKHDFAAFQAAGSDVASTVRDVSVSRISDCGLRIDCGCREAESAVRDRHAEIVFKSTIRDPQSEIRNMCRPPTSYRRGGTVVAGVVGAIWTRSFSGATGIMGGSKLRATSAALAPFAISCVTNSSIGFFVPSSSSACGGAATSPPAATSPAGLPSFKS
jgi:tRNA pseudouridine38-40 synthase